MSLTDKNDLQIYSRLSKRQTEILSFVQTDEEKKLTLASFDKKIKDFTVNDVVELNSEIAKWSMYLGEVNKITANDIMLIQEYIVSEFPDLSITDIKEAIRLSMTGIFGDPNLYGLRLNVAYIATKLVKYKEYKVEALKNIHKRLESHVKETPYNPEFAMKSMIDSIKDLYADNLKNGELFDSFNVVYDYFKKLNLFKITAKEKRDAIEYATAATIKYYEKAFKSEDAVATALANKAEKDIVELRYCKNYLLSLYFKKNDLKDILAIIKLEHFIKKENK